MLEKLGMDSKYLHHGQALRAESIPECKLVRGLRRPGFGTGRGNMSVWRGKGDIERDKLPKQWERGDKGTKNGPN